MDSRGQGPGSVRAGNLLVLRRSPRIYSPVRLLPSFRTPRASMQRQKAAKRNKPCACKCCELQSTIVPRSASSPISGLPHHVMRLECICHRRAEGIKHRGRGGGGAAGVPLNRLLTCADNPVWIGSGFLAGSASALRNWILRSLANCIRGTGCRQLLA